MPPLEASRDEADRQDDGRLLRACGPSVNRSVVMLAMWMTAKRRALMSAERVESAARRSGRSHGRKLLAAG
jgi:hypothetical protein